MSPNMKFIKIIVMLLFISSCAQSRHYYELQFPYKNYAENYSPLAPIQALESDSIYRIWLFESTSIDRLIVIAKDVEGKFQSSLLEFGFAQNKKVNKEVYRSKSLQGKDSLYTFMEYLQKIPKVDTINNMEVAYDEPIKHYILERKLNNTIETIKLDPEGEAIKDIKNQFNLNN